MAPTDVPCFFLDETPNYRVFLRRYSHSSQSVCKAPGRNYHNAQTFVADELAITVAAPDFPGRFWAEAPPLERFLGDERWPRACECGYEFRLDDEFQVTTDWLYTSNQREGLFTREQNIPGMMWDAWWYGDRWKGTDGRSLVAVCPDGKQWVIDSRASNCTRPNEDHDCWCRHGEPPNITVDKTPEPGRSTCQAGAGSIQTYSYINGKQTPSWHGFLRNGIFVT